jgi:hypothetical protein
MKIKKILLMVLVLGLLAMSLFADNGRIVYENVLIAFGPSAMWTENYNHYPVSVVVTVKLKNGKVLTSPTFIMKATPDRTGGLSYWDQKDIQEILTINVSRR